MLGTIIYIRDHLLMGKDRVNIIEMERKKVKAWKRDVIKEKRH